MRQQIHQEVEGTKNPDESRDRLETVYNDITNIAAVGVVDDCHRDALYT